jgi:hypothetical protein
VCSRRHQVEKSSHVHIETAFASAVHARARSWHQAPDDRRESVLYESAVDDEPAGRGHCGIDVFCRNSVPAEEGAKVVGYCAVAGFAEAHIGKRAGERSIRITHSTKAN